MQIQGQFKRIPKGELYVGADITTKMELGMLSGPVCRMMLKFIKSIVNDLHYSFGDSVDDPDRESAHLVAPLM
jgi:hypothetical protein